MLSPLEKYLLHVCPRLNDQAPIFYEQWLDTSKIVRKEKNQQGAGNSVPVPKSVKTELSQPLPMKTVPNNEHFTTNYLPQGGLMGPWAAYLIDNFTRFRWQDPLLNLTLGGHCSGTNLGCILYITGPTRFFETMKDSFLKKILTVGFDSDGRSFHQNSIEMMKAETTNQIQKHWISQNLQTFSIKF